MFYIQYSIIEKGHETEKEFFAYDSTTQEAIATFMDWLKWYNLPTPEIFTIAYEKDYYDNK